MVPFWPEIGDSDSLYNDAFKVPIDDAYNARSFCTALRDTHEVVPIPTPAIWPWTACLPCSSRLHRGIQKHSIFVEMHGRAYYLFPTRYLPLEHGLTH
jgi:hypothetical protein